MSDTTTQSHPSPLAPTELDLAAWNALTRDEQISRYKDYLSHPDCDSESHATMSDILREARAKVKDRRLG